MKNGDLLEVFKRKVSHKGYQISKCKSAKVKAWTKELWEPVFQSKQPKSRYMLESFTRTVIYEILYSTNVDWAKLACTKWRAKLRPAKIHKYSEGREQLIYWRIILQRLHTNIEEIGVEIAQLEEKRKRLNKIVQDIRQQPNVLLKAERCKEIERDFKKLKKKLHRTKVDLKHSKKMAAFSATDPNCIDEAEEWSQRVTTIEENVESLNNQILELHEINNRENAKVLKAVAVVKDVKIRIAKAMGRLEQIWNLIKVHGMSNKQPQKISPSCVIGEHEEFNDEGCLKPCTLCGRGFLHQDIVMASCGCHYYPWGIVFQAWNSNLCYEESCREVFMEPWRRNMDLHNIEGNAISILKYYLNLESSNTMN